MTVAPPPAASDAAKAASLATGKNAVDAFFLADATLKKWLRIQKRLRQMATAAQAILVAGKHPAVAANEIIDSGAALEVDLLTYTAAPNRADADAAMIAKAGLTQGEIDDAVEHLNHGIAQMKATPADGSEVASLCTMLLAYYTEPASI